MKKIGIMLLCSMIVLCSMSNNVQAAGKVTTKLQGWDLVDSGKHLDWGGTSKYIKEFKNAVKKWNNYKAGVIRKDTIKTKRDVKIMDSKGRAEKKVLAETSKAGRTIYFYTAKMDSLSSDKCLHVCMHELGHALGLGHNKKTDVMYAESSWVTKLSKNDKASYDKAYKKY